MTEQPPHMSRSSACPGPPLLLLSPPQSHIPTHPHSPHPYLPSHHCLPSSCGYCHHSPLPSSCRPHYCSPLPRYHSPSSHYHSPSPHYHSPLPCYCSPSPCGPCCSLPSPHGPSHRSPSPHEPLHHPPSPCGPHCSPSPGHGLSHHAPLHGQHSPPHSYSPSPPHPSTSRSVPVVSNGPSGMQLASFGRGEWPMVELTACFHEEAISVQFQEWGVFTVKHTTAKKRGHLKDKNGNPVG